METSLPRANGSHEDLIRSLATGLSPVRRLAPPPLRALMWLAVVAAVACALAAFADLGLVWRRISATPDMSLAVAGSILTMALAALAAFQLSLPDAPRAWALLPLPAALLWIVASGLGCLRGYILPNTHVATGEAGDCLVFIVALSVPLSAVMILMLRRACSLQPGLTTAMGGLAAAAAAATLLNFFHPFDAAATDLAIHAIAIALVITANRAFGPRMLGDSFLPSTVTRG